MYERKHRSVYFKSFVLTPKMLENNEISHTTAARTSSSHILFRLTADVDDRGSKAKPTTKHDPMLFDWLASALQRSCERDFSLTAQNLNANLTAALKNTLSRVSDGRVYPTPENLRILDRRRSIKATATGSPLILIASGIFPRASSVLVFATGRTW